MSGSSSMISTWHKTCLRSRSCNAPLRRSGTGTPKEKLETVGFGGQSATVFPQSSKSQPCKNDRMNRHDEGLIIDLHGDAMAPACRSMPAHMRSRTCSDPWRSRPIHRTIAKRPSLIVQNGIAMPPAICCSTIG